MLQKSEAPAEQHQGCGEWPGLPAASRVGLVEVVAHTRNCHRNGRVYIRKSTGTLVGLSGLLSWCIVVRYDSINDEELNDDRIPVLYMRSYGRPAFV